MLTRTVLLLTSTAAILLGALLLIFLQSNSGQFLTAIGLSAAITMVWFAVNSELRLMSANRLRISDAEIAGEKIRSLAWNDEESGLYSFIWMKESLEREIRRSMRYDSELSILVIRLDESNFESQSIHAGSVGSAHKWRFISDLVLASVRNTDIVARFPGEYTVGLLLPQTNATEMNVVLNRLIERVELETFEILDGTRVHVRFESRSSSYPNDGTTINELLAKAQF